MRRRNYFLWLLLQSMASLVHAQNMTSPYSIYGIGDMDNKRYDKSAGMGGTSMALSSSAYILDNNPASIMGLQRSFLTFQGSALAQSMTYSGSPVNLDNRSNRDFWIKSLALGIRINNWWASSFRFRQFSNVNYSLTGSQFVEGTASSYNTTYTGDGSLSEFAWTNGVSLGKHLTMGAKATYIGGGIQKTETLSDDNLSTVLTTTVQDYYGRFRFEYGARYQAPLSKKTNLSVGMKFIPRATLVGDQTLTVSEGGTSLVEDSYLKDLQFDLPNTYSGGFAITRNNRTTYAADFTHEDWSSLGVKGSGWQLTNTNRVSAGVQIMTWGNSFGRIYEKRFVQFGTYFGNSYIQVRNNPIQEFGVTAGMGGHLGNGLYYALALSGGQRGTTVSNLVREHFVSLTMTFSYSEFLRSKIKKYRYD